MSEDAGQYDDRVDTDAVISSASALGLMLRAVRLLTQVKGLFAAKALLALAAIFPPLTVPWFTKIIVDQVILDQPFNATEVRFPPFMLPFLDFVDGMAPMGIMLSVIAAYAGLLLLFGTRGEKTTLWLAGGQDAATQSEMKLSGGNSQSGGVFGALETVVHIRLSQRLANLLRTRLFTRMTKLPMTTLDDHRTGDAVYRVMYDSPEVPEICLNLTLTPVLTVLGAVLTVYIAQYSYGAVAPELVWVTAALVPMILLVTLPFSKLARHLGQASRASGAATTNAMEENLHNISAVQSLGATEKESAKFEHKSAESFRRHLFVILLGYLLLGIGILSFLVGGVYLAIYVLEKVALGEMSVGDWPALYAIFVLLTVSASTLGAVWINLQGNVAAIRRIFFFIDLPIESFEAGQPLPRLAREVALQDVDVVYPDGRQALHHINVTFSANELVAIVGPTGAGKTSLAYLLPKFLQPERGKILFDGIDLAGVDVASLRAQVTYVFQEHTLLSKSIRDNFLLVKPDASDADIAVACAAAGAEEFIASLPDGIDTVLGRSGDTLSVGQQQRLSIARGLIRDTPVLILDEPTAALDPQTENALVQSLVNAAQDRLVLVIAHRLSTIRKADRIVFLDEGRIIEIGNHEQLMQNIGGAYAKFVTIQLGDAQLP